MSKHVDVVVVGGGVNGCAIAYECAKRGYEVALLERQTIGAEASSAAAGMLGAQVEFDSNDAYFQFACESRERFPELVLELEELTNISIGYRENGMLKVALTNEEVRHLQTLKNLHEQAGQAVEWWTPDTLKRVEPHVSEGVRGALFFPHDRQVKADHLTLAFSEAARQTGVHIYDYTNVQSLIESSGRVTGVRTVQGDFLADQVIVTAGAWSSELTKLPFIPVKGEIFSVRPNRALIKKTLHSSGCYIVPKVGGDLYIGATEVAGSFQKNVTVEGLQQLMQQAQALIPEITGATFQQAWAGVRPQTIDGKPYIGKGHLDGLWIATGHYRNGILLSAMTSEWLVDLMEGRSNRPEWEEMFSPRRALVKGEDELEINY